MTNNKQTYKPHDKTISPFSDFITNSTNEEKEEVLTEVVKLANEDIEKMIKNRPWRERLGGLDFNPAYKKQIIKLVEDTLKEQIEIIESFKFMPYDDESLSCTELFANKVLDDVITQLKK